MKKEHFLSLPKWLKSNVFYRAALQATYSESPRILTEVHPLDANLISSEKANGKHMLMLDLDQSNVSFASSTSGHSHIYINADLSLEALKEIVGVLAKHGILQPGIQMQLEQGNCLTLRPPGVQKGSIIDNLDIEEYKSVNNKVAATLLPSSVVAKIEQFNNVVTSDFKKYFNVSYETYGHSIRVHIEQGRVFDFLNILCLKLGLDPAHVIAEKEIHTEYNYAMTQIYIVRLFYKGDLLAEGRYDAEGDLYMLEFKLENFGESPVPHWPSWEKITEIFGKGEK